MDLMLEKFESDCFISVVGWGGDDRIILGKFWRVVLTCSCDGDRKRPVID